MKFKPGVKIAFIGKKVKSYGVVTEIKETQGQKYVHVTYEDGFKQRYKIEYVNKMIKIIKSKK